MNPLFSLCHTTARLPDGWIKAADAWWQTCAEPDRVEHVLAVDQDSRSKLRVPPRLENRIRVVTNKGRQCAVDGWNATARAARGKFLITVADDWFPCENWDQEIVRLVPDMSRPVVLEIESGGDPGILTFSLLTRAYLDKLRTYGYDGGFFYPEYLGMWADAEFSELARKDGVVIDARHLKFPHEHPFYTGAPMDPIHKWQHRPEALQTGEDVFLRRMSEFLNLRNGELSSKAPTSGPPLGDIFGRCSYVPGILAKTLAQRMSAA